MLTKFYLIINIIPLMWTLAFFPYKPRGLVYQRTLNPAMHQKFLEPLNISGGLVLAPEFPIQGQRVI